MDMGHAAEKDSVETHGVADTGAGEDVAAGCSKTRDGNHEGKQPRSEWRKQVSGGCFTNRLGGRDLLEWHGVEIDGVHQQINRHHPQDAEYQRTWDRSLRV